jgi:cell fate regulator YaaT (PSP1 superfamily)
MDMPSVDAFDVMEIRFKNGRKEFYRNNLALDLVTGDPVVVEASSGYHLGHISLQGELVRLQMNKHKVVDNNQIKNILRLATESDSEKFEQTIARNLPTMYRTREIIRDLSINMKLSDVEFQADNTKATFYYSADERVDFRELIKLLASEFKIRVEMKQISLRQEASRLGGIGVCGRELCCSTWLTDFKSVSTAAARYQNLSLNPSKLSGQCGRLKCCLNYELETYMEALEYIPTVSKPLNTLKGKAILQKTDIFRQMMWFGYYGETTWHPITIDRVNKIMEMNQEGQTPDTLQEDKIEVKSVKNTPVLESMANKMSNRKETTDLDNNKSKSKNRNKKRKKRSNNTGTSGRTNSNNSGDLPK